MTITTNQMDKIFPGFKEKFYKHFNNKNKKGEWVYFLNKNEKLNVNIPSSMALIFKDLELYHLRVGRYVEKELKSGNEPKFYYVMQVDYRWNHHSGSNGITVNLISSDGKKWTN